MAQEAARAYGLAPTRITGMQVALKDEPQQ